MAPGPSVALTGADTIEEGASYTVTVGDVTPASYAPSSWFLSWGDGSWETSSSYTSGKVLSHTYADGPGWQVIQVNLTCTDGKTYSSAGVKWVFVSNAAPTATLVNDGPKEEGSAVTVSFTDVADSGVNDTFTYSFDWDNDGTYDIVDQTSASAQHSWAATGTYTVKGRIKDKDGGYSEHATDPGADIVTAWTVHWGDGSSASLTHSGTVTHAYTDGPFSPTITIDLKDEDGLHAGVGSKSIAVNNVAPTAMLASDGPKDEGQPVTVSFTSVVDPGTGDVLTYSFDWDNDGNYDVAGQANPSAQHTWDDQGRYTVRARVSDDDGGASTYTTDVVVRNAAPKVSATAESGTAQYSEALDEIVFTATDVAADTMTAALTWSANGSALAGTPTGLTLSPASCSENAGTRTCEWRLSGTAAMAAGSYTLRLTVTDKDGSSAGKDVALTVQAEEATVTFDGSNPVAVPVAAAGGASGAFDLVVAVSETDPASPGNINLAQVSLSLVPVGPGNPVVGTASRTVDGVLYVTFHFSGVPVNTYQVQVTVSGSYVGSAEDVLVVYDPSLGYTTGGGWFYWPRTRDRTTFGYTMKYNKKGSNVQGSLLLVRHLADGTIYRVKSNALDGLALGEDTKVPMGWATFSGKCTYQEPGWAEAVGNRAFTVYVEDRNEPGNGADRFWIAVADGLGMDGPAAEYAVTLGGGNLVVPHKAK